LLGEFLVFPEERRGMNISNLRGASAPNPIPKWLPPAGGLLVSGAIACFASSLPLVHSLSFGEAIASAMLRVLAVFIANAVTVLSLCAFQSRTTGIDTRRLIWQTSLVALWLAPLALFIRENSAWAMAAAAVLVFSVAKSFLLLQKQDEESVRGESQFVSVSRGEFSLPETPPWCWRQICAAGAALCAQTGLLSGLAGYPFTGATLIGISSAVWTRSFMAYNPLDKQPFSGPRGSTQRALLAAVLAIVFMAAGLSRYLRTTHWSGTSGVASSYHLSRRLTRLEQRGQRAGDKTSGGEAQHGPPGDDASARGAWLEGPTREQASEGAFSAARNSNSGVILWPNEQMYTKLVAPAPLFGSTQSTSQRSSYPLTFPFNGVYWFYKAPDLHPPDTSRQLHGSPETLDIHSVDRRPLTMEAHENLGSLLDLDCCSRVQIAIRNADSYPDTVSLELILINSTLTGKPSQSLGTLTVKSARSWKLYEKQPPAIETLTFPIPANHSLGRFDELMIVFRLEAFRADDGAKIAIDHFVLVPRGL
jgi:hypothetical protein